MDHKGASDGVSPCVQQLQRGMQPGPPDRWGRWLGSWQAIGRRRLWRAIGSWQLHWCSPEQGGRRRKGR